MQDDRPPENDVEKNPGPFQFSLSTLFFWVTVSAILTALYVNGPLLPLLPSLHIVILIPVVVLCVTDILDGQGPQKRTLRATVFVVVSILTSLAIARSLPAIQ